MARTKPKVTWNGPSPSKKTLRAQRRKKVKWGVAPKPPKPTEHVEFNDEGRFFPPDVAPPGHHRVQMPHSTRDSHLWKQGIAPGSLFNAVLALSVRYGTEHCVIPRLDFSLSDPVIHPGGLLIYAGTVRVVELVKGNRDNPISVLKHMFVCTAGRFIIDELDTIEPVEG